MQNVLTALDGNKTYIAAGVGILVILTNHFIGPVPGVQLDSSQWLTDIWSLVLVMAGRSGMKKIGK